MTHKTERIDPMTQITPFEINIPDEDLADPKQRLANARWPEAETVDDRHLTETWYALSPRPETQPAYDIIVVDYSSHLWVREWSALGPATRWWVFASGGDLLGSVDVPSGMTITSVSCGWVWGIEQDELDVSYVVRYALRGADAC